MSETTSNESNFSVLEESTKRPSYHKPVLVRLNTSETKSNNTPGTADGIADPGGDAGAS